MVRPEQDRALRLAEQLRENLRKRKAQARALQVKSDEVNTPSDESHSR